MSEERGGQSCDGGEDSDVKRGGQSCGMRGSG